MAQYLEVVEADATPVVWSALRNEAQHVARSEPGLASILNAVILRHDRLADALSYQLARKLGDQELRALSLRELADEVYRTEPCIVAAAEADLRAVFERDPACKGYVQPLLFFKGFLALQAYRVAHWLWLEEREAMALYLQSRMSEL
ncbi:MAG: serine O-acetyltransferase, partial [Steroidobacteraceae bacterium]